MSIKPKMKKILIILVALIGLVAISVNASTNEAVCTNNSLNGVVSINNSSGYDASLVNRANGWYLNLSKEGSCSFFCNCSDDRSGTYKISSNTITFSWPGSRYDGQIGTIGWDGSGNGMGGIFSITINGVKFSR